MRGRRTHSASHLALALQRRDAVDAVREGNGNDERVHGVEHEIRREIYAEIFLRGK